MALICTQFSAVSSVESVKTYRALQL